MLDFKLLLEKGNLGYYTSCEMTHAFIIDKKNGNKCYNFYTIFVMEERNIKDNQKKFLTDKPIRISDRFSLGCYQYQISLEEVEESYRKIKNTSNQNSINIGVGDLCIGKIEEIVKQFVPQDSTETISFNKVLKNNFDNGSYILEFFEVMKPLKSLMTEVEYKKATEKFFENIPIDLFVMTDRIGNFVFQFPSSLCSFKIRGEKNDDKLNLKIKFDKRVKETSCYEVLIESEYDNHTVGFSKVKVESLNLHLHVGDATHSITTTIIDSKHNIILGKMKSTVMRKLIVDFRVMSDSANQLRTVMDQNKKESQIKVEELNPRKIDEDNQRKWEAHVDARQYKLRLDELEKRKEFLQYGLNKDEDREKALQDIRSLMNSSSGQPIYLWDPYLSAQDLLDTCYFTKAYGVKIKAITSKNTSEKDDMKNLDWIKEQKEILNKGSNHYGINLEFRCQHGNFGYNFHDRFLMVLNQDNPPKVWSLGKSINNIGKSHHIIHLVSHPRHVIDAFENLWDQLDDSSCIIWDRNR